MRSKPRLFPLLLLLIQVSRRLPLLFRRLLLFHRLPCLPRIRLFRCLPLMLLLQLGVYLSFPCRRFYGASCCSPCRCFCPY